MIALHRKVHEPKTETLLPLRESIAHLAEEYPAQRRQPRNDAQSDVRRVAPAQRRTAQMGNAGGLALRRPARTLAGSAPYPKAEGELAASCHNLDLALILIRASS